MRNSKVILAIVMAVLLAGAVFSMLPKAAAQSGTTLHLKQSVQVVYSDNSVQNLEELSPFTPAQLTGQQGKTVQYLDFRTIVITNPSKPMILSSAAASIKISVLTSGGYANIATTGADTISKKLFGIDDTQWQIFYLRVPAASFDSAIGSRTSDFPSEIRFSVTGQNSIVKITAKIANISDDYLAFPITAVFPMTAKSTGGINPEPCATNCSDSDPSGKIWYKISIQRPDGTWVSYVANGQLTTFNLFTTPCVVVNCYDFKAISYEKWVKMDNDVFNMPGGITYDNPGFTGNYGIYVNGQAVAITSKDTLTVKGSDNYIVLSMTAQEVDILPRLTDHGVTGNVPGEHSYSGTIDFIHQHAKLRLTTPTQVFNVDIPQQTVTVGIGGLANPDNADPCNFSGGVTDCPDPETNCIDGIDNDGDGYIDALDSDCNNTTLPFGLSNMQLLVVAGGIVLVAGIAVMARGKHKR